MLQTTQPNTQNDLIATLRKVEKALKKEKKKPKYKYLKSDMLDDHMAKIVDFKFKTTADKQDRIACKEIAKGFTYTIPHVDRYLMRMRKCLVTEQDLQKHYADKWHTEFNEAYRNHIRKGMARCNAYCERSMSELEDFVNRQSKHLNELDDLLVEEVMDLASEEVEVRISTDLRSYVMPAPVEAGNQLNAEAICVNVALNSKGMVYYSPSKLAAELRDRGFERGPVGWYVKLL
jgi:YesN/AraC family two-component response regulator